MIKRESKSRSGAGKLAAVRGSSCSSKTVERDELMKVHALVSAELARAFVGARGGVEHGPTGESVSCGRS